VDEDKNTGEKPRPGRWRIVLAEDHDDGREMMVANLALSGYEVHAASNGRQALQLVEELRPHAVISDLEMPDMNGFQLARAIREKHGATIRLIALTGLIPRIAWTPTMDAGFDYYLLKPVTGPDLIPYIEGEPEPRDAPF
jgi:two-component system CheB/CheR fusion protein